MLSWKGLISAIVMSSTFCVPALAQSNPIDGITSASEMLQLISGEAFPTYAVIVWNDYYNNGSQHLLKYGTTTDYGDQLNLKPFTRQTDVTDTIKNLTPETEYFAQFYRVWDGQAYTTDFTFTTTSSASVLNPGAFSGMQAQNKEYSRVSLFNASGRKIGDFKRSDIRTLSDRAEMQNNASVAPGVYAAIFYGINEIRGTAGRIAIGRR